MTDGIGVLADAMKGAAKIVAESQQRGANEAVKEILAEKRHQIENTVESVFKTDGHRPTVGPG